MECCSHLKTGGQSLPKYDVNTRCTHSHTESEGEGERRVGNRERGGQTEAERQREKGRKECWVLYQVSLDCSVMLDKRLSLLFKPIRVMFPVSYNIVS